MEVAFNGHPRQSEIRSALDAAFAATDTTASDDNYSRAGSALVALRKKYGIDEMEISSASRTGLPIRECPS
ncbi:hypothetical protein PU560_01205 [Georgenia sp. 10Sc9-8]|uniref:DUF2786 domain-containing protein n=1 Tax=Georgenia halotolerans TaxID=3028317 RepID=A0ABT5TSP3_9MICO|nr:hypothetical protein [Georgenia halotolerans]